MTCSFTKFHQKSILNFPSYPSDKQTSKQWDKQDHQALLRAKYEYCPQLAAVSCTQKAHKKPCDLDLWCMTLKFGRLLEVVEVHDCAKFHQAKCSGSWVMVLTTFLPYLAMVNNPKIWSSDLDLWPMTLIFLSRYMFMQTFTKLHATVLELLW